MDKGLSGEQEDLVLDTLMQGAKSHPGGNGMEGSERPRLGIRAQFKSQFCHF